MLWNTVATIEEYHYLLFHQFTLTVAVSASTGDDGIL